MAASEHGLFKCRSGCRLEGRGIANLKAKNGRPGAFPVGEFVLYHVESSVADRRLGRAKRGARVGACV
jgi:hypothetical protein